MSDHAAAALNTLKNTWNNVPPSWVGGDPCGSIWQGITCTNSRVTSITLASMGLKGKLSGDIAALSELIHLDLSYNKDLTGIIPTSIGALSKLKSLFLIGCGFTGHIPASIGYMSALTYLYLGNNLLTGPLPANLNNLTSVSELILSNNAFTGPMPNLTGMAVLSYLDMSNNSFLPSVFPSSYLTLQSLTTIKMEGTNLQSAIPVDLFSLPNLITVILSNNQLNGTLDIGSSPSSHLRLVDLQKNQIIAFMIRQGVNQPVIILVQNPICQETRSPQFYCTTAHTNTSYVTPPN